MPDIWWNGIMYPSGMILLIWWNDLMWTDVPGGKVVDFIVFQDNNNCETPIETTGFTDTSAHAFVQEFEITSFALICDLKVLSQHPVGGEFIGIDSTIVEVWL